MAAFSGALRLIDLDDFITPSQVKLTIIQSINYQFMKFTGL